MDQRRIISLGRGSLVISLPKYWLKLNGLKKGDEVSLTLQQNRSLVVIPGTGMRESSREVVIEIKPEENSASIIRRIIACYLNGYSGIRIISNDILNVAQQRAIREAARNLFMNIMEATTKGVHIEILIDDSKAHVSAGIQRMHAIADAMCKDTMIALKNFDASLARVVFSLDTDVDHLSFLEIRLLRSAAINPALANELSLTLIDCLDYQTLVHRIEQTADQAANIVRNIIVLEGERQKIPSELLELMAEAGSKAHMMYSNAVKAYFSRDMSEAERIIEQEEEVERLGREIASKTFANTQSTSMVVCSTCSIRDSIRRMAEFAGDIAEISINRMYELRPRVEGRDKILLQKETKSVQKTPEAT
ncbi:MAG: phosphate uptake regulator PhoU [Candidatus Atabeyarchaeum deiterrae]